MSRVQEADIIGDTKLDFYIRQLIILEKQIEIHKRIHYLTPTKANNKIQSIGTPKDETLDWNNTPNKFPKKNER